MERAPSMGEEQFAWGAGGGGSFPSIFDRRCDPPALRARDGKGGNSDSLLCLSLAICDSGQSYGCPRNPHRTSCQFQYDFLSLVAL